MIEFSILFGLLFAGFYLHVQTEEIQKSRYITKRDTVIIIDTITKTDTVKIHSQSQYYDITPFALSSQEYQKHSKEWYAFDSTWKYEYSVNYNEKDLLILTNIIFRESGGIPTLNHEIDQYFVGICAIRVMQHYDISSVRDLVRTKPTFSNTRGFDKRVLQDNPYWLQCYQVAKNVLDCKIPNHIPYLPKGTFFYWNSRLDTNMEQKRLIESKCVSVASTIVDHHYYAMIDVLDVEERSNIVKVGCNPIKKNIKNGKICNK